MKWLKITIETTTGAEDIIISSLYDLGLEGAQIEDKQPLTAADLGKMFVDIPLETPQDSDNTAYLHFFAEIGENDNSALVAKVEDELRGISEYLDIGTGRITLTEVNDGDFRDKWKEHFHQFAVADLLIVPSWEQPENAEAYPYLLRIDPGAAFGTGAHETTRLCLQQLRQHIRGGERVLDIGCGSGILGIAALLFGAKQVCATDLDPLVVDAVRDNCQANGIGAEQLTVHIGDLITDGDFRQSIGAGYNIAAANIVANVLIPLAPVAHGCLNRGGLFMASGILADKEEQVAVALRSSGFSLTETTRDGEWVCITAKKT
jgi:ribosomal protein L11 methyltransferase